MNLSGFFFTRKGIPVSAMAKVIVVRSQRQPRLLHPRRRRCRRQHRDDVVAFLFLPLDCGVNGDGGIREREAGNVRVARVERLLHSFERLVRHRGEQDLCDVARDAHRHDSRSRDRRIEAHRNQLTSVRRPRTGDDQHAFGAVLTGRHGLVPQVRVAGEYGLRLLIRVLGEVTKHEDDPILDVEAGVAVVAEILPVRHDNAVAGEDEGTVHVAVVGEGKRANRANRRDAPDALVFPLGTNLRPAVSAARRELEWQAVVRLPWDRPCADSLKLGHDVVRGQTLAGGPCQPALELFGGQRLNVSPRAGTRRGRGLGGGYGPAKAGHYVRVDDVRVGDVRVREGPAEAGRQDHGRCRDDTPMTTGHDFLLGFLGGACRSASSAFSWFHWARNSCPADPPDRLDVHASILPSGDGTGKPSNPSE